MPLIPVYEGQAHLDPDQAPRYRESMASAQAAEQTGRAVQQLGRQLGSTLSAFAERSQQQATEAANFATGLQDRALQNDLAGAYTKSLQSIPANGFGFSDTIAEQADAIAKQRFDQMPAGPSKDRAMQTWATVGRDTWVNRAAGANSSSRASTRPTRSTAPSSRISRPSRRARPQPTSWSRRPVRRS